MGLNTIKEFFVNVKRRFQDVSIDSLLWIVNIVPSLAGFSIRSDRVSAPFWIVHWSLLVYVYAVGNAVYQWKFANEAIDYITSFINVSLLILIGNNSWWFLANRRLLKSVLHKIEVNDELSRRSEQSRLKHKKLLKIIKRIVLVFYMSNYVNASFIYLPNRVDVLNNYAMTPCVGMEPLTVSPNRELCLTILCMQEFSIMTVVLNFQALLLCFIAHTAVMFQILADEIMALNNYENLEEHQAYVKEMLPIFVKRHSLTLSAVDNYKSLYSVPLGVNFGSNALTILLILYLPVLEWFKFIPIFVFCFMLFFLYCFLCQKLVNASEAFETAIYCCGWENFALREMKMIYVMLHQAQKPVELLAADIVPVNMNTFATTLQAMYKFVTVVKF
ncbi:olfactory receptor 54 [Bombyx mori]|uniref:Odorant receptor n=1 Tax=Bombyx mori TaxID=7091 RepID=C4B7Y2_BOMMO|nr:olfactory receptor 54 [Bombyx mori]BAH66348.1 olfactory receptor [Bombyx mori]